MVYPPSSGTPDPELHPKVTLAATSLSLGGSADTPPFAAAALPSGSPPASPTPAPAADPAAPPMTVAAIPPAPDAAPRSGALETTPAKPPVPLALRRPEASARQETSPGRGSNGGLNINSASVEALDRLPGGGRIGQTIARHRPYASVEDLVRKRVLRRSVYEQIKSRLAAD